MDRVAGKLWAGDGNSLPCPCPPWGLLRAWLDRAHLCSVCGCSVSQDSPKSHGSLLSRALPPQAPQFLQHVGKYSHNAPEIPCSWYFYSIPASPPGHPAPVSSRDSVSGLWLVGQLTALVVSLCGPGTREVPW